MRLIQFHPARELTRRGVLWPLVFRACDEFHNRTLCIIIPHIGSFTIWEQGSIFHEPEHVYGASGREVFGIIKDDCQICDEILTDFTEHMERQFRGY